MSDEASPWRRRLLIAFIVLVVFGPIIVLGPLMPVWEGLVVDHQDASWAPSLLRNSARAYNYTLRPDEAERCYEALILGGYLGTEKEEENWIDRDQFVIDEDYDGQWVLYEYADLLRAQHPNDKQRAVDIYQWLMDRYGEDHPRYEYIDQALSHLRYGPGGTD